MVQPGNAVKRTSQVRQRRVVKKDKDDVTNGSYCGSDNSDDDASDNPDDDVSDHSDDDASDNPDDDVRDHYDDDASDHL